MTFETSSQSGEALQKGSMILLNACPPPCCLVAAHGRCKFKLARRKVLPCPTEKSLWLCPFCMQYRSEIIRSCSSLARMPGKYQPCCNRLAQATCRVGKGQHPAKGSVLSWGQTLSAWCYKQAGSPGCERWSMQRLAQPLPPTPFPPHWEGWRQEPQAAGHRLHLPVWPHLLSPLSWGVFCLCNREVLCLWYGETEAAGQL